MPPLRGALGLASCVAAMPAAPGRGEGETMQMRSTLIRVMILGFLALNIVAIGLGRTWPDLRFRSAG